MKFIETEEGEIFNLEKVMLIKLHYECWKSNHHTIDRLGYSIRIYLNDENYYSLFKSDMIDLKDFTFSLHDYFKYLQSAIFKCIGESKCDFIMFKDIQSDLNKIADEFFIKNINDYKSGSLNYILKKQVKE